MVQVDLHLVAIASIIYFTTDGDGDHVGFEPCSWYRRHRVSDFSATISHTRGPTQGFTRATTSKTAKVKPFIRVVNVGNPVVRGGSNGRCSVVSVFASRFEEIFDPGPTSIEYIAH